MVPRVPHSRRSSWFGASAAALCFVGAGLCWATTPEAHTTLPKAREAALANAASPEGAAYQGACTTACHIGDTEAMVRCLRKLATRPKRVSVFIRVATDGSIQEVLVDPETNASKCFEAQALASSFPKPPRDEYWVALGITLEQ